MAIVDGHGRVLGRWNLVDVLLGIFFLVLIPLAYGAYLLFREPTPTLTRVEPAELTIGPNMRFKVRGENLRPYLRVSLDNHQGKTFLYADSTEAQIDVPDVPPGTYDVVLYDQSQERHRLPKALTIRPSAMPEAKLVAIGTFGNLRAEQIAGLKPGLVIDGVGVVEAVGTPVPQTTRVFVRPGTVEIPVPNAQMVPARLRMACFVRSNVGQPECVGGGLSVQPTTLLFLDTPNGRMAFQIDQVLGPRELEPVRITVRFSGEPGVVSQIRVGDRDLGDVRNELSATGTVDAIGRADQSTRDVRMTVQAQRDTTGWTYAMTPLRLGSAFTLRTPKYEVRGQVIELSPEYSPPVQ